MTNLLNRDTLLPSKDNFMTVKSVELGCPGHFICASSCRWRRHTQVGRYRISTVGDYYENRERRTLGGEPDSWFETMVFETSDADEPDNDDCGCKEVTSWSEVDGDTYSTAGDAQAGHEAFILKYLRLENE